MTVDETAALARALDHSLARTAGIEMASDAQLLIDALASEGYVIEKAGGRGPLEQTGNGTVLDGSTPDSVRVPKAEWDALRGCWSALKFIADHGEEFTNLRCVAEAIAALRRYDASRLSPADET